MKTTFPQNITPALGINAIDDRFGLIGYVVIDRTVNGSASGGVRYAKDVSVEELSNLARAMTFKWAFLNNPMGGAKGGIFASEQQLGVSRAELMQAYGRAIAPLVQRSVFNPGVDLGTSLSDLREIMTGAGKSFSESQIDGSYATAMTVLETIQQLFHVNEISLRGIRVALEGFGKVGGFLAQMLESAGAVIVALSTITGGFYHKDGLKIQDLLKIREAYGDDLIKHYPNAERVSSDALYALDVDLLIPGARTAVINEDNAASIQAQWIVPIANYPITEKAESLLIARGVCIVPDFISNSGGIMASAMHSNHFGIKDVQHYIETYYAKILRELFLEAKTRGEPITVLARQIAWENHLKMNQPGQVPQDLGSRLTRLRKAGPTGLLQKVSWRLHKKGFQGKKVNMQAVDYYAEMTGLQILTILKEMRS